jgi:hypothetical protein
MVGGKGPTAAAAAAIAVTPGSALGQACADIVHMQPGRPQHLGRMTPKKNLRSAQLLLEQISADLFFFCN